MEEKSSPEKQKKMEKGKNENGLSGKAPVRILVEIISANNLSPRKRKKRSLNNNKDDYMLDWIKENERSFAETETGTDDVSHFYDTKSGVKVNSFCRVEYKQRLIHQTLKITNNNNPIWTIDTRSLFIINTTLEDIRQASSANKLDSQKNLNVNFEVRNKKSSLIKVPGRSSYDMKNSASIGFVSLSLCDILEKYCTEERFEFELSEFWGNRDDKINHIKSRLLENGSKSRLGSLALRFRLATGNDALFVQNFTKQIRENESSIQSTILGKNNLCFVEDMNEYPKNKRVKLITEMDEAEVAGNDMVDKMASAAFSIQESMVSFRDQVHSITSSSTLMPSRMLVKPHPDPRNPTDTRFMSKDDIDHETFSSASHNWVKAGSGKLGKIYLEVLACHDLPNTDVGEALGNVTDPFVTAVYEDVLIETPVIQDELSPRWLPWTQRAFILHMMHPSSMLYLGVFDFDLGLASHQPIGRVAVNIGNLKKDITYTLKYDLFPSSIVAERKVSHKQS